MLGLHINSKQGEQRWARGRLLFGLISQSLRMLTFALKQSEHISF